jgi:hypothetical protein
VDLAIIPVAVPSSDYWSQRQLANADPGTLYALPAWRSQTCRTAIASGSQSLMVSSKRTYFVSSCSASSPFGIVGRNHLRGQESCPPALSATVPRDAAGRGPRADRTHVGHREPARGRSPALEPNVTHIFPWLVMHTASAFPASSARGCRVTSGPHMTE